MTATALGSAATVAVYSALVVLTGALVTFSLYVARTASRLAASPADPGQQLVHSLPVSSRSTTAQPAATSAVNVDSTSPTKTLRSGHADTAGAESRPRQASEPPVRIGAVAVNLTYLATLLLVAAVITRGVAVSRPPNGNMYEFSVASAAAISLLFSAVVRRRRWEWLGAPITGVVLLLLTAALLLFYTDPGPLMPALRSYWLGIHVTIAITAVGFFAIGAILTILQLAKERTSRSHRLLAGIPPPDVLEANAYGLNIVGFILWTFTLLTGALWAEKAWGAYWQWDPKEVWTFIVWLIYAAYLHARATSGRPTRRAAWLALAGSLALILNFTIVNLSASFAGLHNYSGL